MIPTGVRGLLLAGLVAAFMSTFSSVVNAASSMLVRDVIQPACSGYDDRTLVRISYFVTVAIVVAGVTIGFHTDSINAIWQWMLAGLIGGMLIPNILRWHWWRLNGWGYSFGLFGGLLTALVVVLLPEKPMEFVYGPVIWGVSLVGAVLGSLLTRPTSSDVLGTFYTRVRPFGMWAPVKAAVGELPPLGEYDRSVSRIVLNVLLALTCLVSSYLFVFFFIGHFHLQALLSGGLAVTTGIVLWFTWYRTLPQD
jgi:Na+/proline symporter